MECTHQIERIMAEELLLHQVIQMNTETKSRVCTDEFAAPLLDEKQIIENTKYLHVNLDKVRVWNRWLRYLFQVQV